MVICSLLHADISQGKSLYLRIDNNVQISKYRPLERQPLLKVSPRPSLTIIGYMDHQTDILCHGFDLTNRNACTYILWCLVGIDLTQQKCMHIHSVVSKS